MSQPTIDEVRFSTERARVRSLQTVVLRPMALAGLAIAVVCGTGNAVQALSGPTQDPLGWAAVGWFLAAAGMAGVVWLSWAGRTRVSGRLFLGVLSFGVFGIALFESAFGSILMLTVGSAYAALCVVSVLPARVHQRWRWGLSVGTTVGLAVRHGLRPLPQFDAAIEMWPSVLAAGVAVFAIALLAENQVALIRAGTLELARAVDELEKNEQVLVLSRDRALDASRAKAAFLANMSHELRTPLNAILGYVELMQEEAEEEPMEASGDLENVSIAARHLLSTITDILDLSRIEAGQSDLELATVDVGTLAAEVFAMTSPLVSGRGNELILEVEDLELRTDRQRLCQVVVNLVGNAAKFTQDGTVTLRAVAQTRRSAAGVRFEVEDTGAGIDPSRLDCIFDPFNTSGGSTRGTGIGLTISKAFTERLGGDISVESTLNQGSTFSVWVPDRTDDGAPD